MAIRLLIVDDSPTVRAVLKRVLKKSADIEVVGEAADGAAAVAAVVSARPDVVLMDVEMPVLDGWAATERIMATCPTPILVVTSRANRDQMRTAFEALRRGALDVLPKPEDTDGWHLMADALPAAVRAAFAQGERLARPGVRTGSGVFEMPASLAAHVPTRVVRYVAIGASTGGPGAIRDLLDELPADLPATVMIVQHIAAGFDEGLAEWLSRDLGRDIRLARDGEPAAHGVIRVAPGGSHLRLAAGGVLALDRTTPPHAGHRPSANELFASCAAVAPRESAGVLLTGMGSDGAAGLATLRRAGGLTLVQDEASCTVFGMPRAALEAGGAEVALPPRKLACALKAHWPGGAR